MKKTVSLWIKRSIVLLLVTVFLPFNAISATEEIYAKPMDTVPDYLCFNELSAVEKAIYCGAFIGFRTPTGNAVKIDVSAFNIPFGKFDDNKEVSRAVFAIGHDFPGYSWLNNFTYRISGGKNAETLTITPYYSDYFSSDKDLKRFLNKEEAAVRKVVESIPASAKTRYDRVAYINDYIVKNCEYSMDAFRVANTPMEMNYYPAWTAYGALIDGKAVCEGYSKAMKLCLDLLGIPCVLVSGNGHEWNEVQMEDGKWYLLDATFNDPVYSGNVSDSVRESVMHDYLLIGQKTVSNFDRFGSTEHVGSGDYNYPEISTSDYDASNRKEEPLKVYNQPLYMRTDSETDDFSFGGDVTGDDLGKSTDDEKTTEDGNKDQDKKTEETTKASIKLNKKVNTIKKGKSKTFTVKGVNVTGKITVKSSNKKVLTVKKVGTGKYKITGKKKGTVTLTIKVGTVTRKIKVKVN